MKIHILTLFPEFFESGLKVSLLGKAIEEGRVEIVLHDLKQFKIKGMIDDEVYGGGPGMLIKPDVIDLAITNLELQNTNKFFLSPDGFGFNQALGRVMSEMKQEILILCGRYEGVDSRVLDYWGFQKISIGDFVLCGGEVAALMIVEACVRLIPGVLGDQESVEKDTFQNHLLEHEQYTRPRSWKPLSSQDMINVPEVLTTGNHENIEAYRKAESKQKTIRLREELWERYKDMVNDE